MVMVQGDNALTGIMIGIKVKHTDEVILTGNGQYTE